MREPSRVYEFLNLLSGELNLSINRAYTNILFGTTDVIISRNATFDRKLDGFESFEMDGEKIEESVDGVR